MVRSVLSIFVGAIIWMAGFLALAALTAALWPDYQVHGRLWTSEGVFTFTSFMACFNLFFWAIAAIAAGWIAMKIATRYEAVLVLAALIELYVVALHIILFWSKFPWWYNLGVVIPAIPAILLGARLAASEKKVVLAG